MECEIGFKKLKLTRDPTRIRKFCNRLASAWEKVPDLRFGQFMIDALGAMDRDPFFPEDDRMIEYLEEWAEKNSPYREEDKMK